MCDHFRAVVRLLEHAGVEVPADVAVPVAYTTTHLSGRLDLPTSPSFYQRICDINHMNGECSTPVQTIGLDVFVPPLGDVMDGELVVPGFVKWH